MTHTHISLSRVDPLNIKLTLTRRNSTLNTPSSVLTHYKSLHFFPHIKRLHFCFMAKVKIAGAWSGVLLEVDFEKWTVPILREEVAKRLDCEPDLINLICAGKVLKDGDGSHKLIDLGFKNNAKVLASRVSLESKFLKQEFVAEEERASRFSRLKAAAIALAKRHADGSLPVEDFNLELENQNGEKVHLGSETEQRAIMMGLMLHANAKQFIRRENYKDALEVLTIAEEAFSICQSKIIETIDNVPILQIDIVWCYFMLRDIGLLSEAGARLAKAREGIIRAHGKESSRVRLLQGGRYPELALHLRLELLEGVVAYHCNQLEKSRHSLTSAQAKYLQLQVSDEALSLLMSMGYNELNAKRALRMNNQNVESAVDFFVEEKAKREQKKKDDIRRRKEIMEQKKYGMTPLGKAVDINSLNELSSFGFARDITAEALRRNENATEKALDDLTNPDATYAIQTYITSRERKRLRKATEAAIEELTSMGFPRETVTEAVQAYGTKERALSHLLGKNDPNAIVAPHGDPNSSISTANNIGTDISIAEVRDGASSSVNKVEGRDVEMEDEITEELQNGDTFSDYDIEVIKEGEAINEYLGLLDSKENIEERDPSL